MRLGHGKAHVRLKTQFGGRTLGQALVAHWLTLLRMLRNAEGKGQLPGTLASPSLC
jgi:hypothetical protein